MAKFYIYELVPEWHRYCKIVEADTASDALALIDIDGWAGIEAPEDDEGVDDTVEEVSVRYEAAECKD